MQVRAQGSHWPWAAASPVVLRTLVSWKCWSRNESLSPRSWEQVLEAYWARPMPTEFRSGNFVNSAATFESATSSAFKGPAPDAEKDAQKNDRIGRFVREWFHAARVEELPIPTAIVTTDLNTCAPYIFTRGPLEVAIRATCAFPGLFKPVEHEGRLLADGCIVSPVPTAVAARMNARFVFGVSVGSSEKNAFPGARLSNL